MSGLSTLGKSDGFSLVELLVVVVIIILLIVLISPILGQAKQAGERGACMSNLRQLHLANALYADAHGSYVAAASDLQGNDNRHRWHGVRDSLFDAFDGSRGPLLSYIADGRQIRHCPGFRGFTRDLSKNAFEASCGGYGYNATGVGSRSYTLGFNPAGLAVGMDPAQINAPSRTVMFADAAFGQPYGSPEYLIEYSFAEPYFVVDEEGEETTEIYFPSIHFRHNRKANVVWCDGHVSSEQMETESDADFTALQIGWFGGPDNELFDPY